MAFHVFQKTKEADWAYRIFFDSKLEVECFLLHQDTKKVVTGEFFIIDGDKVPLIKEECLVIKRKE